MTKERFGCSSICSAPQEGGGRWLGASLRRAAVGRGHFPLATFPVPGQAVPSVPLVPSSDSCGCRSHSRNFALMSVFALSPGWSKRAEETRDKGEGLSKGCSGSKAGKM